MFRLAFLGTLVAIELITAVDVLAAETPVPGYVAAAVANSARPPSDVEVDVNRKPAETIAFAGVKPGMSVGEFFPGGGYLTRMLSGVVGANGHVCALENEAWTGAGN